MHNVNKQTTCDSLLTGPQQSVELVGLNRTCHGKPTILHLFACSMNFVSLALFQGFIIKLRDGDSSQVSHGLSKKKHLTDCDGGSSDNIVVY